MVESQSVDYKRDDVLDRWHKLGPDVLGLANTQDGGWIVVGVNELENHQFDVAGISATRRRDLRVDTIRGNLCSVGCPRPEVDVQLVVHEKRSFVLITVLPSTEKPVICVNGNSPMKVGTIYYRNGGAITAPAAATDWDEIWQRFRTNLRIATMRELQDAGLIIGLQGAKDGDDVEFERELEEFR